MLISSSSFSGRLKFAAYKLTRKTPITPIDFNITLVIYRRHENKTDIQIMSEKQNRRLIICMQIKVNVTIIHHLFAANKATRDTTVKPKPGQSPGLTRVSTRRGQNR